MANNKPVTANNTVNSAKLDVNAKAAITQLADSHQLAGTEAAKVKSSRLAKLKTDEDEAKVTGHGSNADVEANAVSGDSIALAGADNSTNLLAQADTGAAAAASGEAAATPATTEAAAPAAATGEAAATAGAAAAPAGGGSGVGAFISSLEFTPMTIALAGVGAAGAIAVLTKKDAAKDTTPPIAPVVAVVASAVAGATSAEAQAGAVTVTAEAGSSVAVTFTQGTSVVTKTITATGSAQVVVLSAAEVATLGNGAVTVSAIATDAANNHSLPSIAGSGSFTLDTIAPSAPAVAVAAGTAAATSAEAQAGAVTVNAENGSTVVVTFTHGANTVTKTVTGTGAAQAVTLTSADVTTLGDGAITVSAVATDVAGNVSPASVSGTGNFTLDTVAPGAPVVAVVTGAVAATSAEAQAGAVTVNAEAGSSVAVTFTHGANTVTKTVTGTGSPLAVSLTSGDVTALGDGVITVSAVATDVAGNPSAASVSGSGSFTLDTAAPSAPVVAVVAGATAGATSAEAQAGAVTVNAEAGSSVAVTFTQGVHTVTKIGVGTGSAQAVALSASDVTTLGDGAITVSAVATDTAGNASPASASGSGSFTLDTVVSAPTVALTTDSGTNTTDHISNVGTLNVTGTESGAALQYSINSGITWAASFTATEGANAVQVRQTDVAGNVSTATPFSFTLDTTAPTTPTMTTLGSSVVLTYNETLDTVNVPATSAFAITVNGVPNTVTAVAVLDMTVTLTLTTPAATGATVNLTYTDLTPGNDVLAIQDLAGNDASGFATGVVADGYVRGAHISIQTSSGLIDTGVVTDAHGQYILPASAPSGVIVATGGVNIDTGVANTLVLKAPAGSSTISPLTTLVQAFVETNAGTTTTQASAAVVAALGLTTGTNLTTYDPVAALAANPTDTTALAVQKAGVQVATIETLAAATPVGTATAAVDAVVASLVTQITAATTGSTTVDLTNTTVITTALGTASTAIVADITDATTAINDATTASAISTAQSVALDTVKPEAPAIALTAASDTGSSSSDKLTNDTTPTVRVNLNTTSMDGTAVVEGNIVKVLDGSSQVGTATLSATDIANGYVDVTATTISGDGVHAFTATITDAANNTSTPATALNITLDTTAAAPAVALTTDSGSSTSDGISNIGTLHITGTENGSTVQYSVDGGTTWTNSFSAVEGVNTVKVQQTDAAGNVSAATTFSFTLDTTVAAPTVALTTDSGSSASDGISNIGTLNVTGTENGSTTQYSIDGGTTWTNSFSAVEGVNTVKVHQTDAAGNVSAATSFSFTLDTTVAAPTVALTTDSGSSATDGISNVGTLHVTGTETNALVEYSIDNGTTWTGSFSAVTGANAVQVRQTDTAGNTSTPTSFGFTLDTTAAAPTVALTTDSGSSAVDGLSNIGTLNVTGTENGSTVQYSIDGGTTWTNSFSAMEGVNNVKVHQTDAAGNISNATAFNFTLDTTVAAPVVALTTDSGSSATDRISNIGMLNVTGTENGSTVQYSIDGGTTWTNSFNATEGPNNVKVHQTDAAGNVSAATSFSFTSDTIALAPTVALTTDTGSNPSDHISTVGALSISGTETNAVVEYSVDSGGTWNTSFTAHSGSNAVQVRQTDVAGNVSNPSATFNFTLDNAAPTLASSAPSDNQVDVVGNSIALTFNEAVHAGTGNILISDGTNTKTIAVTDTSQVAVNGNTVIITPTPGPTPGASYNVQLASGVITDLAGNAYAGISDAATLNFTMSPAPAISSIVSSASQAKNGDALTFTVTLSETVTVNTTHGTPTLTLNVGGTPLTASYIAGSGTNSLTFSATTPATGDSAAVTVTAVNFNGGTIIGNSTSQPLVTNPGQVVSGLTIDNTPPHFNSGTAVNFAENATITAYASSVTDITGVTYSLGGTDANLFTLDTSSGALTFNTSPNFEAPGSAANSNVYSVIVTATDALGHSTPQPVAVTVTNVNEHPVLTGGATNFAENGTGTAYTATATDPDANTTLGYALGGADANLFNIDSTGAITFKIAPNYEAPGSAAHSNVYSVTVTASDGSLSTQPQAVTITVTNVNEPPVLTSGTSASVAENSPGTVYTVTATDQDAGTTLSYAVAGTDEALFNIDPATGALSFKTPPNYEAPADAGGNNVYDVTVTASDGTNTTAEQAVAITVTNVNEAPTLIAQPVTPSVVVINQAYSQSVAGNFHDVDAGDELSLSYSATGLPTGLNINPTTGVISGTVTTTSATNGVVITATDHGGLTATESFNLPVVSAPVITSHIDNVTNLEVTSNIVLTATENVTAVAGKYIHIINDANDATHNGFHGEAITNTQDILVTDTSQVTIVNNTISIHPTFNLDFNNNYHIMLDSGAFLGVSSGQDSVATADATAMNFSTVLPSSTLTPTASQAMTSGTDALVAGHDWLDAEGHGTPGGAATTVDVGTGNIAIAANDLGIAGISTNDFYLAVNNFGVGDLLYIDNHGDNTLQRQSDFNGGLIVDQGVAPTVFFTLVSGTPTGQNGGQFDVTLAAPHAADTFSDTAALQVLLGVTYQPILYG